MQRLTKIYELLYEHYGPQHWWPGDGRFEIIVGAILTQNTNWQNVERAITNLKDADCLSPEKLYEMPVAELAELIRPAGYYNIKAKRLKNFMDWLFRSYDGNLNPLESLQTHSLRQQLLSVNGIGAETADSILLYAFGKTIFVVDAYTSRVMTRHCLIEQQAGYEQLRELFESNLPADAGLFNEYHALLVQVGKQHCKPKPLCRDCPLSCLPVELDTEQF